MPADSTPRTVFILEDDEDLAGLMERWARSLYGEHARIHISNNINEGTSTVSSLPVVDIAILDRNLPDGKGDELVQSVAGTFDTITVMITGASPDTEIIELPIDDYVVKPIDEGTFLKRVSLLEKLKAADVLTRYSEARKASLLEYHLDTPEENPLFRRFAARWSYDNLEIAHFQDDVIVYELYTSSRTAGPPSEEGNSHVSITGSLDTALRSLLETGEIEPVGELLPTEEEYAWLTFEGDDLIDTSGGSIGIYRFLCDTPEQYITDRDAEIGSTTVLELTDILESGFN